MNHLLGEVLREWLLGLPDAAEPCPDAVVADLLIPRVLVGCPELKENHFLSPAQVEQRAMGWLSEFQPELRLDLLMLRRSLARAMDVVSEAASAQLAEALTGKLCAAVARARISGAAVTEEDLDAAARHFLSQQAGIENPITSGSPLAPALWDGMGSVGCEIGWWAEQLAEAGRLAPLEPSVSQLNLAWVWLLEHPEVAQGLARRRESAALGYRMAATAAGLPRLERLLPRIMRIW